MQIANLRPLRNYVFIQRDETPTNAGLIALAGKQPAPECGTVVAIGPGRRSKAGVIIPPAIQVGDRVMFGRYANATIKSEIGPLLTLREDELYGVLEAEA